MTPSLAPPTAVGVESKGNDGVGSGGSPIASRSERMSDARRSSRDRWSSHPRLQQPLYFEAQLEGGVKQRAARVGVGELAVAASCAKALPVFHDAES